MSTKQYLTDAATRHQIFLQRYGGGQSKEAVKVLNQLRRSINARLSQEPTLFQRQRLATVLHDIELLSAEAFNNISAKTIRGSLDLANAEASFSTQLFNKATVEASFTLPASEQLVTAVMTSNMKVNINSAVIIEDALANFGKKKTAQIMRTISDGVTLGETTPTISRNVGNLINNLQRRQLDTLVRTITNNTSVGSHVR
jgi:phage host-nuclease inhibitor protein Gam